MQGLSGKVVLITGAGSGLGRESAIELAREGSRIAVVDVNAEGSAETVASIVAAGGEAYAVHGDVAESASVQKAVAEVLAHFGTIDILVNNAGVVGELKPVHEVSEESCLGVRGERIWKEVMVLIKKKSKATETWSTNSVKKKK